MNRRGLGEIVRALGGDLYAGGQRACVPGPGHSRLDRSVSLALVDRRVIVHSFAGDDWRGVRDDLRRRGLIDANGRLTGSGAPAADENPPPAPGTRVRLAQSLWSEGRPLDRTPAERHLRRRGLLGPWSPELRAHPGVPSAVYLQRGVRRPALLAAIRDGHGAVTGVEVTYVTAAGDRAPLQTPRKTVGRRPPGSAVRLTEAGPEMLVAEGVVSALSAIRLLALPGWALMSAGNLAQWAPPDGVVAVVIAADRDATGLRSAWRLLRRLRQAGLACRLARPPAPHRDWNESLLAAPGFAEPEAGTGEGGRGGRMVRAAGPEVPAMTVPEDRQVLIPDELRAQLLTNGATRADAVPVLKLFNPAGAATWLISEMDPDDHDRLFGLCDLGMGSPELGYVSLEEITSLRLPFGLRIERDEGFRGRLPLTVWADIARDLGSISEAEEQVARLPRSVLSPPAPEIPGG